MAWLNGQTYLTSSTIPVIFNKFFPLTLRGMNARRETGGGKKQEEEEARRGAERELAYLNITAWLGGTPSGTVNLTIAMSTLPSHNQNITYPVSTDTM